MTNRKVCEILIFSTYGQKYFQHMAAQKLPDTKMNLGGKIHIKVKRFFQETSEVKTLNQTIYLDFCHHIYILMKSILSKEEAVKHNIFLFASLPVGFKTSLKLFKGQKVFSFNYLVTHKYLNIKLTIMEIFCYTNVTSPFAQRLFHTSYII